MNGPAPPTQDVALVCPTYQEGATIATFLERVRRAAPEFRTARLAELIFVDDGSTDGTVERIREAEATWDSPRIALVQRAGKDGTVSAQIAGFRVASTPLVATMDADGQHPVETLDRMVTAWDPKVDLVVASRYITGGGVRWEEPRRAAISGGARILARALLPGARRLSDPLSGFFLTRREWVAELSVVSMHYKVLLYVLAMHPRARIHEEPYEMGPRIGGESKLIQGLGFIPEFLGELTRYRRAAAAAQRGSAGSAKAT